MNKTDEWRIHARTQHKEGHSLGWVWYIASSEPSDAPPGSQLPRICTQRRNIPNTVLSAFSGSPPPVLSESHFQHAHFIPIVDVGKERHVSLSMVKPEKAASVTGTTLRTTGPAQADSWQ